MKTAISVPDPIFEAAEELAQRLGLSRSELYATAVAQFLAQYQREAVTKQLNEIYADEPEPLDDLLTQLQALSLPQDEW